MKSHLIRPLYVVLAVIALTLSVRAFVVPKDFGAHERGYMYGWHRKGNEEEWKAFETGYKTAVYCKDCHTEEYSLVSSSFHGNINCENCHGPAFGHPSGPPKLEINRERGLCIRCHALLPSEFSARAGIKGIEPDSHNPGIDCVMCHNPHKPEGGL